MRLLSLKRLTRRKGICLLAAFTCLLLVWIFFRSGEPTYHGRSLGSWIDIYKAEPTGSAKRKRAEYAINQIGSNAVPWLLEWMTNYAPVWKHNLALKAFPGLITATNQLAKWYWGANERARALPGFQALGEKASSAVPALEGIIDHRPGGPGQTQEVYDALGALGLIGSEGLPKLVEMVAEGGEWTNTEARENILLMGTNAYPGILLYTNCLEIPINGWNVWAAKVIGNCGPHA